MSKPEYENFPDYYGRYKDIIDKCIPEAVLDRLLNRIETGEQMGDAWEPNGKYYDDQGELPF